MGPVESPSLAEGWGTTPPPFLEGIGARLGPREPGPGPGELGGPREGPQGHPKALPFERGLGPDNLTLTTIFSPSLGSDWAQQLDTYNSADLEGPQTHHLSFYLFAVGPKNTKCQQMRLGIGPRG